MRGFTLDGTLIYSANAADVCLMFPNMLRMWIYHVPNVVTVIFGAPPSGTGDCCVAWFCPCFALGQVARKLANNGVPTGGWYYRNIVFWGIVWILIDSVIASGDDKAWRKSTSGFYSLFCVIVMTRLRGSVRARYNIQGSCFADCLLSWWCAPCTLTQMVGQLWIQPEVTPGCDISEGPAFLV